MSVESPSPDRKDFLGRGWSHPVELDPRTGRVATVAFEEDVRQSIMLILETASGSRVRRATSRPELHNLALTSLDSTSLQRIRSLVEEALIRCEARIDVLGVTIDEHAVDDGQLLAERGQLLVEIEYRVRKTNQTGNLVWPFYFREGGRP